MSPIVKYTDTAERAARARSAKFRKLGRYGNRNSAYAIKWMVEHGTGLRAFEHWPPGTFEASVRNDREVWFRRA